jgi:hypothetical protein
MLALNAEPILKARLRGFRPEAMVIASLVGHVHAENPIVRAAPGVDYDWRWVRGIEVCAYVGDEPNWHETVQAIARQRPDWLGLWNCAGHWGANVYLIPTADDVSKPVREWAYELDFLPWLEFQNDDFMAGRSYRRTPEGIVCN